MKLLCGVLLSLALGSTAHAKPIDEIQQYIINQSSMDILVDVCTNYKCSGQMMANRRCESVCYTGYRVEAGQTKLWKKGKDVKGLGFHASSLYTVVIYDRFKKAFDGSFSEQNTDDFLYFRVEWGSPWFHKSGYAKALYVPSETDTSLYWTISGDYYRHLPEITTTAY